MVETFRSRHRPADLAGWGAGLGGIELHHPLRWFAAAILPLGPRSLAAQPDATITPGFSA